MATWMYQQRVLRNTPEVMIQPSVPSEWSNLLEMATSCGAGEDNEQPLCWLIESARIRVRQIGADRHKTWKSPKLVCGTQINSDKQMYSKQFTPAPCCVSQNSLIQIVRHHKRVSSSRDVEPITSHTLFPQNPSRCVSLKSPVYPWTVKMSSVLKLTLITPVAQVNVCP